jgi:hypothetical protein
MNMSQLGEEMGLPTAIFFRTRPEWPVRSLNEMRLSFIWDRGSVEPARYGPKVDLAQLAHCSGLRSSHVDQILANGSTKISRRLSVSSGDKCRPATTDPGCTTPTKTGSGE